MRLEAWIPTARALLGACALLSCLAGSARGHSHCNHKKVAALAHDVAVEAARIKANLAREWDRADKASTRYVILEDLQVLHHRAIALEGLVRSGQGRDKTEPVYRRMLTAVEHARRDSDDFPAIAAQRRHIDAAESALRKLADCYGPE